MKILVLGSRGQVGRCLQDQLKKTQYEVVYAHREDIDIGDFFKTANYITHLKPQVVINAAAYTAVDLAETERESAELINHQAVGNIANLCKQINGWFIHFSTNYVFDGNASQPYTEEHSPAAQSVYARTKLKGEMAIIKSGCKHIVVRTGWVFSEHGKNFLKTMIKLGEQNDCLRLVSDQTGCPTYGQHLARAVLVCVSCLDEDPPSSGIYHYCGDTELTWLGFAKTIFNEASKQGWTVPRFLEPVSASEYITAADRPTYAALNANKFHHTFKVLPSSFSKGVAQALNNLGRLEQGTD